MNLIIGIITILFTLITFLWNGNKLYSNTVQYLLVCTIALLFIELLTLFLFRKNSPNKSLPQILTVSLSVFLIFNAVMYLLWDNHSNFYKRHSSIIEGAVSYFTTGDSPKNVVDFAEKSIGKKLVTIALMVEDGTYTDYEYVINNKSGEDYKIYEIYSERSEVATHFVVYDLSQRKFINIIAKKDLEKYLLTINYKNINKEKIKVYDVSFKEIPKEINQNS